VIAVTRDEPDKKIAQGALGSRPLYAQVRDLLIARISSGAWQPGDLIPNEFAIARELGVSQGTIRKALDSLAADNLLMRKQGRGTYVARHTPADMLFRFFNFFDAKGERIEPGSRDVQLSQGRASTPERQRLELGAAAKVIRISRLRTRAGEAFILETIVLPETFFPGLAQASRIPNTLYDHFQKAYGITVARGQERLTVALADVHLADRLGVVPGTPLMKLDRVMYGLQQQPVEWRVSLCRTDSAAYVVELR